MAQVWSLNFLISRNASSRQHVLAPSGFQQETKFSFRTMPSPKLGQHQGILGRTSVEHGVWSQVQYAFYPPANGLALFGQLGPMLLQS
jgi:hypothetical protein